MVQGLALVMCYVSDMARSAAFYRDLLGVEAGYQSDSWTDFPLPGGVRIGLHHAEHDLARGGGFIPGLRVDSLEGVQARLRAAGRQARWEPHAIPGGMEIEVEDPDGNVLQLIEYAE